PFYAVSGKAGVYTIEEVPDGEYEVEAWHEKWGKSETLKVKVEGGKPATLDFTFKAAAKAEAPMGKTILVSTDGAKSGGCCAHKEACKDKNEKKNDAAVVVAEDAKK